MTANASQPNNSQNQQGQEPLDLSSTEVKVLYLLFNPELDLSDIARELFVTRGTVSFHTVNIYSKLSVGSRFEAICKFAQVDTAYREAFFNFLKLSKAA